MQSLSNPVQLEEEATHLESRALQLRETIHSLWEKLEVPPVQRDAFTQLYIGHKPKIIAAVSYTWTCTSTCSLPVSLCMHMDQCSL